MNSAALRPSTAEPAATARRNSLPEAPTVSAAPRAAGRIAIPGWVSMRNVSHLPPAKIISALTKAAPALVSLLPLHNTVAAPPPPASSSCISARACRLPGIWWATRAEDNACKLTPLARSTTSGGRSSYLRLATNSANSRLSDMAAPSRCGSSESLSARHSLRRPPLVASAQGLAQPVGGVRPVALGRCGRRGIFHLPGPSAEPKGAVRPVSCRDPGLPEPALQALLQGCGVGFLMVAGGRIGDHCGHCPQLPADIHDRSDQATDRHFSAS